MKKVIFGIFCVLCGGGLLSASGESFLKSASFPTTFADLPFTTRIEILQEGYMPYESEYDADGRCISNCAYPGITLEKALEDIKNAEQESQKILSETQNTNNNGTNSQISAPHTAQSQNTSGQGVISTDQNVNTTTTAVASNCSETMPGVPTTQNIPFGNPFPKVYRISSGFNPNRKNPVDGVYRPHNGTDIAAPMGTKIYTVANGTVEAVFTDSACGNGIRILHDDKRYKTGYCHLSKHLVKTGDRVSAGCVIGLVGSTGRSTGPHLHYIVYVLTNGKYVPVDPQKGYLKS